MNPIETTAKFNLNMNRDLFVIAEPRMFEVMRTMVKTHYFLTPKPAMMLPETCEDPCFVLAVVDFTSSVHVQTIVKTMMELQNPLVHKLIFAHHPDEIASDFLLLAQEIGVKFVAFGPSKVGDLRDYLKRICVEDHKGGSLDAFRRDFSAAFSALDHDLIRKTIAKLRESGAEGEETLKLLYYAYANLNDEKLAEFQLKQILQLNRQNLWAANTLGRLLLRSGRVAEGIEILERLSLFHSVNSERMLTLGNAYADVGEIERAETLLKAGHDLHEGQDPRFNAGLAKVRLVQGHVDSALRLAGKEEFSDELIRFLNMRAILAMRRGKIAQALSFYTQALKGAVNDLVKAKLYFNMGLACVRSGDVLTARDYLLKSMGLGGRKFRRAEAPLAIVNGVIERSKSKTSPAAGKSETAMINKVDFETMF